MSAKPTLRDMLEAHFTQFEILTTTLMEQKPKALTPDARFSLNIRLLASMVAFIIGIAVAGGITYSYVSGRTELAYAKSLINEAKNHEQDLKINRLEGNGEIMMDLLKTMDSKLDELQKRRYSDE